ncbi:hypothetical protein MWU58_12835 [Flavobacteriaceae bacterium S0825]|uniref:hypothetical protein n=1 Tax=Gaetbulibacter sp. S0825 TaxID=2720084 RepID=UPI001431FE5B|nr:hypothetical protein [Gaetbulibacter sp. S0825]MCK0110186.1 hypothetical protein [Flavobacteriaceae bacterium S0825]NIX65815.1 hypothetical protein [Gaetbulibacter sp. S0825]
MQKFWKIRDSKSNKLIYIKDKTIYKGNPKHDELNKLNSETSNLSFLENLFSIPYSYIKRIENQSGKNEIKIFFGNDSEDELIVKDKNVKQEIFDFLKTDLTNFKYSSKLPSILSYGKAQFFALLFMSGIFLWSLYLAIQIENGAEYEIIGSGRSITGIVLFLANFGIVKNIIGYIIILLIIIISLAKRLKSRSEMEILKR